MEGNQKVDELARRETESEFIVPEPFLGTTKSTAKEISSKWAPINWRGTTGQTHSKTFIRNPFMNVCSDPEIE